MPNQSPPIALVATDAPKRIKPSNYPPPFASQMEGREKRPLGDLFGLTNFGVNLTQLAPGAVSSLRHAHTTQDEFVYVLQGHPTLHTDEGCTRLSPGMCAGFKAGSGNGHRLVNETSEAVVYSTDMAPTIVRDGQFRLFFFSREETRIHVHVAHVDGEAKFWLTPQVALANHTGLSATQLRQAQEVVNSHLKEIQDAWTHHFGG